MDRQAVDWSGYAPIAVIGLEPDELADKNGLIFEAGEDDLDSLHESVFGGPSGDVMALIRHVHSPKPGTQLWVKARTLSDARRQLRDAIQALQLTKSDITWVSPELGTVTIVEIKSAIKAAGRAKKASARKKNPP